MRTFLTYVLAALAVTVVPVAAKLVSLADIPFGDPRILAGAVSEMIVSVVLGFVWSLVVIGALWSAVGYASNALRLELRGWRNLLRGIAAHLLQIGFVFLFALVLGAEAVGGMAAGFDWVATLATALVAGSIWGTVFWIRAPKPITAGIAA